MKKYRISGLLAIVIIFSVIFRLSAQISDADYKALAEVIGSRDWAGFSITPAPSLKDGKLSMIRELYLTLSRDNSITGRGYLMVGFDGQKYVCHTWITGKLNPSNLTLYLEEKPGEGDSLPGGMYWTKGTQTLTIYKASDRPGTFVLKGPLSDGGTATYHQK